MSAWLKDKGSTIGGIGGTIAAFVAVLQLFVVGPMNQRFDAMEKHVDQRISDLTALMNQRFDAQDQRFDAQDERLDRLEEAIRTFDRQISRNEGQIEIIREQINTVDAP